MDDKSTLRDEDITTSWKAGALESASHADPDGTDSDGTDADGTDSDSDTTDS